MPASLFAVSDLHSSYAANRRIVDDMRPESDDDWLIVAGDVDENFGDIERALRLLRQRYAKVIWTPGNHELWTLRQDPVQLRGEARYQALVQMCQHNDILTPEDEFADLAGPERSYDDRAALPALRPLLARARHENEEGVLEYAYRTGVVCTDEMMLHPDPYPIGRPGVPPG